MSVNFNMRMDEQLKERAFPIIESYGLTPAQAIKLFLNQIADTRKIPISFDYNTGLEPNDKTVKAIEQVRNEFAKSESYKSIDEAVNAMQKIANEL